MAGPSILLVAALALGAGFLWDVRGFAIATRRRFEKRSFDGAPPKEMSIWGYRAFGIWCFVFRIARFVPAAAMRRRLDRRTFDDVPPTRLPRRAYRAFGVGCFVFGIAQFVMFAALEH